jgi:DNA polymerase III delta subunit
MAYSILLGEDIREDRLSPCYVFYGEETHLADQFVSQLRTALLAPDAQEFNLEKFNLEETRWADILDVARTSPFFFSPWRIVLVSAGEDTSDKLSSLEEKIIKEYCRSPASRTILIVVLSGKVKKAHPLVRFFSSLRSAPVVLKELKPLKKEGVMAWMDRTAGAVGKSATSAAKERLLEIVGSDLRRIDNELDKLVTFVADRRVIDIDDVLQVCDWGKSFLQWELTNSLEKSDYRQSLIVLNNLFRENVRPEYILGVLANFFRDLLLAKLWQREKWERKEIFASLRPTIRETYNFYPEKFREFFALVEGFTDGDLNYFIGELGRIDSLVKTSDASEQVLLEGFIFDFCRRRRQPSTKKGVTWGGEG